VLPLRDDAPHFEFSCRLDGVTFAFEFRWNDRARAWFMEIRDVEGNRLLSGRRVVLGFLLTQRFADPRLPAGQLVAIDTSTDGREAGPNDLGSRVRILYLDAAEVAAL